MSIKLKDVRVRVARQFPSYFDACFAKCYTLREVDIVADAARNAVDRIRDKDFAIESHIRRIQELEAQVSKLVIAAEKVVESHKRAGEGTVEPYKAAETKLYVKVTLPPASAGGLWATPGFNGIGVIKAIRAATDMGLKDAKDVYDAARAGHPQLVGPLAASKAADFARELAVCGGTGNITPTRA